MRRALTPAELDLGQHVAERSCGQRTGRRHAGTGAEPRLARHERGAVPIVLAAARTRTRLVDVALTVEVAGAAATDGLAGGTVRSADAHGVVRPAGACIG